jgi:hypothetical protein
MEVGFLSVKYSGALFGRFYFLYCMTHLKLKEAGIESKATFWLWRLFLRNWRTFGGSLQLSNHCTDATHTTGSCAKYAARPHEDVYMLQ